MRVALLCTDLAYGGIQRVVTILANGLSQKGLAVDLVLLKSGGPFTSSLSPEVRIVDLDCSKRSLRFLTPFSPLARYFRTASPDATVSFGNVFNRIAGWTRLLYGVPKRLLMSERNTFSAQIARRSPVGRWRETVRSRFLYRQAEACICVSRGVAEDLVELGIIPPEKKRVIYNPTVRPGLEQLARQPVDHPWLQPGQPPVILGVGRLAPQKDFETLLRAFRLLESPYPDARLLLLGDGPDRQKLEALSRELRIDDRVRFEGYSDNPCAYMSRAALLVLPSLHEGLPNTLIEALACGCNVVSTDCPSGPREILEDGRWGRLVPMRNPEAMAEAMRETLAHLLPCEDLRKRAEFFSLERAVEGYCDLICASHH